MSFWLRQGQRATIDIGMNHVYSIIIVGITIALVAIGINVYLWNDEIAKAPPLTSPSQDPPEPKDLTKKDVSSPTASNTENRQINPSSYSEKKPEEKTPNFTTVRINADGYAVIAGRAAPNSMVDILDDGKLLGQVTADSRGEWVFVTKEPLAPGSRPLSLRQHYPGEKQITISQEPLVIVVSERNKDLLGNPSKTKTQALALKLSKSGDKPSTVVQRPKTNGFEPTLSVDTIDYNEEGRLYISGRGHPGWIVHAYLDDQLIGRSNIDRNGGWQIKPDKPVKPGLYSFRADEINLSGKVQNRIEIPFSRADPSKTMPPEPMVVVQPGNSLWRLARRVYGKGLSYTTIYAANKDQIRNPDLIYPGQVFAIPTTK